MSITKSVIYAEMQRRAKLKNKVVFDFEKHGHKKQIEAVFDESNRVAICAGRRGGKTGSIKLKMKQIYDLFPGEKQVFIAKTRKYAKDLLWLELIEFFGTNGTDDMIDYNSTELKIFLRGGAIIILGGCKDDEEISKFRGQYYKWVYIDEAQDIRKSIMSILINEVIDPSLIDVNGGLWMTGTPHRSCSGALYEACHDIRDFKGFSVHAWNLYDNPFLLEKSGKTGDEIIADVLKKRRTTIDDPSIQREFFGRWIKSNESIVYKYDEKKNNYDSLPGGHYWKYVMGIDIGFDDADAIVVLAYCEDLPQIYVVEEFKRSKQDVTAMAQQIKELDERYNFTMKVIDSGALGKKITAEMINRHGIDLISADKGAKWGNIALMNDDFKNEYIKINPETCPFLADEWSSLLKEDDGEQKPKEDARFDNHLCDAALYAWRECYHYTYRPTNEPEFGSAEYYKKKMNEHEESLIKKLTRKKGWFEE